MRVVQVNYAFDAALPSAPALLDRYATLTGWAEGLASAGAEVLTVQQFRTSSNVTREGLPYTFGTFNEMAEATVRFRPDIVHANGLDAPLRTWILRRWLPATPIVVQDHASGTRGRGFSAAVRRPIRRQLMSVVDAFLFSTLEQAQPWREAGLIASRQGVYDVMEASTRMRAVPRDAARAESGIAGEPALLWVGRLNANKDPVTVLDAFQRLAERRSRATLTIIFHEGDLADSVRLRVEATRALRDRVRLVGPVAHERMASFFSAADIFVVGSHHEGSGYALMEAIACGAIPAVTDIPPFRALADAVGHFWAPGDAGACLRALESAAAQPNRQRVIDHFERNLTWSAVGRRAVAIYEEVYRTKRAAT